jgi:hypothetical protein
MMPGTCSDAEMAPVACAGPRPNGTLALYLAFGEG